MQALRITAKEGKSRMRILFVTANRVGDAVLSTGLMAHLAAQHPNAQITIAAGPAAAGIAASPTAASAAPDPGSGTGAGAAAAAGAAG